MNQAFLEHRAKYRDVVTQRYRVTPEMYDEVSRLLAPIAAPVSMRKGEYLQRIGVLAQSVYWLHSGVARTGFLTDAGNEVTLYFRTDGQAAASHDDLLRANRNELSHNFVIAETAIHGYRIDWVALTDRAHLEKWCTHGSSVAAGRCIQVDGVPHGLDQVVAEAFDLLLRDGLFGPLVFREARPPTAREVVSKRVPCL